MITNYLQPGIEYTLLGSSSGNSPAGDIYWGLDLFGRIIDSRWFNTSTTADVDRIKYRYDQNSSRLYRQNTVALTAALGAFFGCLTGLLPDIEGDLGPDEVLNVLVQAIVNAIITAAGINC